MAGRTIEVFLTGEGPTGWESHGPLATTYRGGSYTMRTAIVNIVYYGLLVVGVLYAVSLLATVGGTP